MKVRPLLLLMMLALTACGRETTPAPAAGTDKPTAPEKEKEGHADESEVRVEASMMRDLRVTTSSVETRRASEDVMLLGELAVDERAYAEVGVPIDARVTRVLVATGETVRQGQTLLELQSGELGRIRGEYVSAEARVALAEGVLKRKRDLAAERIVPLREVQEAEAALAEARASMRTAASALQAIGVAPPTAADADRPASPAFALHSPVAGTVIERAVVLGQVLPPTQPAFRIANLGSLWLTVHAFERDAVRIRRGALARITFAALPGETFRGAVTLVGSHVERESRTVGVRIDVQNRANRLRPGMSATAAVPVGETEGTVLSVPIAAVQRVRNEWCVFLPRAEGVFEIRKIGRGRDFGGEVEVLSGLKAGEKIVVDGAFLLKSHAEKAQAGHGGH